MQTRTISPRLVLVAIVPVAVGLAVLIAGSGSARGVGYTDATVRFVVTDATTGVPLPGALIHINTNDPDTVPNPESPQFTLTTDPTGRAEYHFDHLKFSSASGWFENSYSLALPHWQIRETCTRYHAQEDVRLVTPETSRQFEPGVRDRVISIPVELQRAAL